MVVILDKKLKKEIEKGVKVKKKRGRPKLWVCEKCKGRFKTEEMGIVDRENDCGWLLCKGCEEKLKEECKR